MSPIEKLSARRRRYAQIKLSLLKSFVDLIKEKPLDQISVDEICKGAGVSKVTFYSYFHKKSDLVVFFIQLHRVRVLWHVKHKLSDDSAKSALREIIRGTQQSFSGVPMLLAEFLTIYLKANKRLYSRDISFEEKVLAYPDLPGVGEITLTSLPEVVRFYLRKAKENHELEADPVIAFPMVYSIVLSLCMEMTYESMDAYSAVNHFETLWKGLGGK